jgi:hypothetical protein
LKKAMRYFNKNYDSIEENKTELGDKSKKTNLSVDANSNQNSSSSDRDDRDLWNNLNPESNNHEQPMPQLNPQEERIYKQLQRIQYMMDDAFAVPCTCGYYRVGLDPLVGLIPVLGDCASAVVSLVLVARAAPVLSKYTTTRMLINVGIDATVGMIPLVGDVFDFGFKANSRNLAIFEQHMKQGVKQRRSVDKFYVCSIVALLVFWLVSVAAVGIFLTVYLILWLTGHLSSS